MNEITIKGYHGTNSNNCRNILNSNYRISKGDKEWLGDGVYFFIEGISSESPKELAKKWVIAESSKRKHKDYAVIESEIKVNEEKLLDLTTKEGLEVFIYYYELFLEEIKKEIDKGKPGLKFYDGFLINLMRKKDVLPIEVVKGNFYIKFEEERKNEINFRTSNCTICAVYNPEKNINKKSNKVSNKGKI
jgi:uncharacterized protein MJ0359